MTDFQDRPTDDPGPRLNAEALRRYQRHLLLPEVGEAGQLALARSSVLIVGMGGLGSPAALYLAAAGVGRLGLVDDDTVDASNLQRQVLYTDADVGLPKTTRAARRLARLNALITIEAHNERLTSANGARLVGAYDIVLDGSDNFTTRYLLNDLCVQLDRPLVSGSLHRFDGQVAVYWASKGPCYRCLFPEPPAPGRAPSCAEAGVLGILPGLVGVMQATEAIKLILGLGRPLIGRLLTVEALGMNFSEFNLPKDPACRSCGSGRRFHSAEEVVEAFPPTCSTDDAAPDDEIDPRGLMERLAQSPPPLLVDVREEWEWRTAHIEGARLVPLSELPRRLDEVDATRPVVAICHVGERSAVAVRLLQRAGYRALNLAGGMVAWTAAGGPTVRED
ncbi:MAG: molybdopterin-synthase adenylyltransferase MoeB [Acidobacteriota bacterium]|nr:molybdopterin-synthase adenylyltransferase MoeB [Acidobacteriota bacterium]MDQ7088338.1 molybdopterin-synthase adenylyltransferase MoeB [Acidobacteriota bacterium]